MTSLEELLRQKLQASLQNTKRDVATTLLVPPALRQTRVVEAVVQSKPVQTAGKPKLDPKVGLQQRRQKKMLQIRKNQGQLQAQSATAALGSANPQAAQKRKERAVVLQHKVGLGQAELKTMHK